jgi:hypothetical protein
MKHIAPNGVDQCEERFAAYLDISRTEQIGKFFILLRIGLASPVVDADTKLLTMQPLLQRLDALGAYFLKAFPQSTGTKKIDDCFSGCGFVADVRAALAIRRLSSRC